MKILETFSGNTEGHDYAVGDIHGNFSALETALSETGFDKNRDRLFALGDLIDRGHESESVLEWLEQPWFFSVMGNHEVMLCAALSGNIEAANFHQRYGGEWFYRLTRREQEEIGEALSSLPLAIEINTSSGNVGLIHGDYPFDDWQYIRDGRFSSQDVHYSLWLAERFRMQYRGTIRNIRAVVHGHMHVHEMLVLGNAFFIDTYRYNQENSCFTFLDLNNLDPVSFL